MSIQMQTFICIDDFEYLRNKYAIPHGRGVTRYSTIEAVFGDSFFNEMYEKKQEASKKKREKNAYILQMTKRKSHDIIIPSTSGFAFEPTIFIQKFMRSV